MQIGLLYDVLGSGFVYDETSGERPHPTSVFEEVFRIERLVGMAHGPSFSGHHKNPAMGENGQ